MNRDDAALLCETVDEFPWAANSVVDQAWHEEKPTPSKAGFERKPHEAVRSEARLHANPVQNARTEAADAVSTTGTRW